MRLGCIRPLVSSHNWKSRSAHLLFSVQAWSTQEHAPVARARAYCIACLVYNVVASFCLREHRLTKRWTDDSRSNKMSNGRWWTVKTAIQILHCHLNMARIGMGGIWRFKLINILVNIGSQDASTSQVQALLVPNLCCPAASPCIYYERAASMHRCLTLPVGQNWFLLTLWSSSS